MDGGGLDSAELYERLGKFGRPDGPQIPRQSIVGDGDRETNLPARVSWGSGAFNQADMHLLTNMRLSDGGAAGDAEDVDRGQFQNQMG